MANSDSDFWREFAANFQAFSTPYSDLRADWTYVLKSGTLGDWRIVGDVTQRSQFESLARRAAVRLPEKRCIDLLVAWLTALKEASIGFILSDRFPTEINDDGSRGATYMMGSIARLCEASAHLCRKLESMAVQAEHEQRQRSERLEPQPAPAAPKREAIGDQIRRLREECRLTVEELAAKIGIEPRSIQRHEAGKSTPYARHIRAYERAFSKLLNRQIVISKLS